MGGGYGGLSRMGPQYGGMMQRPSYGMQQTPMAWSNPNWRPAQQPMPQMQQATGIGGAPVSSPPSIVQQYLATIAAQQGLAQQKQQFEQQQQGPYVDNSAGV